MKTVVCGRWNKHSSRILEAKALWKIRNLFDAHKTSLEELENAELALRKVLFRELEATDVDIVGDFNLGLDSVYDVARVFPACSGFKSLTRIPDTNHFHRQPEFHNTQLDKQKFFTLCWQTLALTVPIRNSTNLPKVVCLPGPYSLARQTQNAREVGFEKVADWYAEALGIYANAAFYLGVKFVRFEEPAILNHPEDQEFFRTLMRRLVSTVQDIDREKLALATWYRPVSTIHGYFELPFTMFFVDFVSAPQNFTALASFPKNKKLVAGIFDARQTYEEDDDELNERLGRILEHVPEENVMLGASTDLHFLPWDDALAKTSRLVQFARVCRPKSRFSIRVAEAMRTLKQKRSAKFTVPDKLTAAFVQSDDSGKYPSTDRLPYPTSSVGSFPQPIDLRVARMKLRRGEIHEKDYRTLVFEHTKKWMGFQREIGIDLPVTGEFGREDMAAFFGTQFGGRLLDFVPSYENRRYRPVEYIKDVELAGSEKLDLTLYDYFSVKHGLGVRELKETITGPATLADWALIRNPRYYEDRRDFRLDLARAIRVELERLIALGAHVLQVDEPALTTKMDQFHLDCEAIYETVRGLAPKAYLILHICYSDMEALDRAFPEIIKLPFHQIHIEMANRNYAPIDLIEKHGLGGKDIGLGVIDVHTDRIETVDEIVEGVARVRKYFRPDQIWLTPDCGLKERSEEIARKKLHVMCEAARVCREKIK